jgi:hypothetical protein
MATQEGYGSAWMPGLLLLFVAVLTHAAQPGSGARSSQSVRAGSDRDSNAIPWREVTPEELAMTSEPLAPGATAIYLYRQIDQDHDAGLERVYQQLKVLSEAGRNHANVQIAYRKQLENITGIEARVIHPDGTIVAFTDTVYDRPLVARRSAGVHIKSFTLPDVRIGSVIEYRFRRKAEGFLLDSRWMLSQDLFTRHARFSLRPNSSRRVQWSWPRALPQGTAPPVMDKKVVRMETRNVPAFVTEPQMPPPDDLAMHVRFNYVQGTAAKDAAGYWRDYGKQVWAASESAIGNPERMRKILESVIAAGDSDEQKVRKIYEHVRGVKTKDQDGNLPPELAQLAAALRGGPMGAEAVARNGEGYPDELQYYFIALVRAAGIQAVPVRVASRAEQFFDPGLLLAHLVNGMVAAVTLNGQDVLLDPAAKTLPFGQLQWHHTGVPAIKVSKEGGQWMNTPPPRPQDASTRRDAKLELSEDGVLEGTVKVTYAGHEASWRLAELRREDEQARREYLEEELRKSLATTAEVRLLNEPDWDARDVAITIEYGIKLPEWAVSTGDRMLVGIGLFGAEEKGLFTAPVRQHPVYFPYPSMTEDALEISLPEGYRLQSAPQAVNSADSALGYVASVTARDRVVSIRRALSHNLFLVQPVHYPRIHAFFQLVRGGDETQLVLAH